MNESQQDPLDKCEIIAKSHITAPAITVLSTILRENGFAGSYGVALLHRYYGCMIRSKETSNATRALIGIFGGKQEKLLSANWIWLTHGLRKDSMSIGFQGKKKLSGFAGMNSWVEFDRYQSLMAKLGSDFDLVGRIRMSSDGHSKLDRKCYGHWIGFCPRGWLLVDCDYWLLERYNSLSELLCLNNGEDFCVE
jgi:hypothetical protein